MKTLTILGATGSIGTSALKVVDMHPDKFRVKCLTCATNIDLLAAQIKQFRPAMVAVLVVGVAISYRIVSLRVTAPLARLVRQSDALASGEWQSAEMLAVAVDAQRSRMGDRGEQHDERTQNGKVEGAELSRRHPLHGGLAADRCHGVDRGRHQHQP